MGEANINLALIGRLVRHRWWIVLTLAVMGAALGGAASLVVSPGYVSSAKVLLQGRTTADLPGEIDIATSLVVLDKVAADLHLGVAGETLQRHVSASLDNNVITINAGADTPEQAQRIADKVTTEYLGFSNQIVSDTATASAKRSNDGRNALQQQIDEANKRITELQASPDANATTPAGDQVRQELQQEQTILTQASKQLDEINNAAQAAVLNASLGFASARLIQQATLPIGLGSPTLVELVLIGAVVLPILGVIGHLLALRADRRLRDPHDVASALGAPLLGDTGAVPMRAPKRSLVGRLLHDDRRWAFAETPVAESGSSRNARYQRILRRIPTAGEPADLLLIVGDDDLVAEAAAVDFALGVAAGGRQVELYADADFAVVVGSAVAGDRAGTNLTINPAYPDRVRLALRLVALKAKQQSVPASEGSDGVIVFTSSGARTGWDLAAIAGVCAEAGLPVHGVVLVRPGVREAQSLLADVGSAPQVALEPK